MVDHTLYRYDQIQDDHVGDVCGDSVEEEGDWLFEFFHRVASVRS